ncbi:MAG: hypothetical protein A3I70_00480 [Deltaproteobacteria bacterium RIFCSPLOWO2_02_FULL_44_34]|nr:MAG: hypothetical protein A3I70_00480 [Deltaproteobacteria bacterium RIFCSPLOWO2_02_FULL_44_34]
MLGQRKGEAKCLWGVILTGTAINKFLRTLLTTTLKLAGPYGIHSEIARVINAPLKKCLAALF